MTKLPQPAGTALAVPDIDGPQGWTPVRRQLFLDELAASANITAAAKVAGLSARSAYQLRQRDSHFAAQWQQALQIALDELEALLIDRVRQGTETGVYAGGILVGRERVYSDRLAMFVLNRHRPAGFAARVAEQTEAGADRTDAISLIEERLARIRQGREDAADDDR